MYESHHLFIALFGLTSLFPAYQIAKMIGGARSGFFAIISVLLLPTFYGHLFINSKDVPFAVMYIWSIYFLLNGYLAQHQFNGKHIVLFGISAGLTMAIRVGGLILFPIVVIAEIISCFHYENGNLKLSISFSAIRFMVIKILISFVIAYIIMLYFWPAGLMAPLTHPLNSLFEFSNFAGKKINTFQYFFIYFPIKLPPYVFVGMALILVFPFIHRLLRKAYPVRSMLSIIIVIVAAIFPLLYMGLKQSHIYNELRHVLFSQVIFAILAGTGFNSILLFLNRMGVTVVFVLLTATAGYQIRTLFSLHPYQYVYYSPAIGGVPGAFDKGFPLDYWCTGYRECALFVKANSMQFAANQSNTKVRVLAYMPHWAASYYLPAEMFDVGNFNDRSAEWYITYTDGKAHEKFPYTARYRVTRSGAPLCVVFKK